MRAEQAQQITCEEVGATAVRMTAGGTEAEATRTVVTVGWT